MAQAFDPAATPKPCVGSRSSICAPNHTPKTNGKADRFVQTSLREWAYSPSEERAAELPIWLPRYNCRRPHGSIDAKPPITRLTLSQGNVSRLHS